MGRRMTRKGRSERGVGVGLRGGGGGRGGKEGRGVVLGKKEGATNPIRAVQSCRLGIVIIMTMVIMWR